MTYNVGIKAFDRNRNFHYVIIGSERKGTNRTLPTTQAPAEKLEILLRPSVDKKIFTEPDRYIVCTAGNGIPTNVALYFKFKKLLRRKAPHMDLYEKINKLLNFEDYPSRESFENEIIQGLKSGSVPYLNSLNHDIMSKGFSSPLYCMFAAVVDGEPGLYCTDQDGNVRNKSIDLTGSAWQETLFYLGIQKTGLIIPEMPIEMAKEVVKNTIIHTSEGDHKGIDIAVLTPHGRTLDENVTGYVSPPGERNYPEIFAMSTEEIISKNAFS